jgi:hypothetical protein
MAFLSHNTKHKVHRCYPVKINIDICVMRQESLKSAETKRYIQSNPTKPDTNNNGNCDKEQALHLQESPSQLLI